MTGDCAIAGARLNFFSISAGLQLKPPTMKHVLAAIRDAQKHLLVEHADVTGVQPAVGVDRLGRRGGILEIADHTLKPAHEHFTGLVRRQRRPVSSTQRTSTPASECRSASPTISSLVPRGQIVTVPVDSVSPYAVTTCSKPSSSRMCRIRIGGTFAAPVIARRSDDRSELPRRSWASSDWKIVGGPAMTVMRFARNPVQHVAGVEHRDGVDRRAADQAREPARLVAERVEERVHEQVAVALSQDRPCRTRRGTRAHSARARS
jgi:hypothetical protein